MNIEQVFKTEEKNIERLTAAIIEELSSSHTPKNIIAQILKLVENRKRYLGRVGEFCSILDFEGIEVVDKLDEKTLKALNEILGFTKQLDKNQGEVDVDFLKEKLLKEMPKLPEHPVGYMVLFVLTNLLEIFHRKRELIEERDYFEYITLIHNLVSNYVKVRETPLIRHFSDVAREYSVIARLICGCKKSNYIVKQQNLRSDSSSNYFDVFEIICKNCGNTKTIEFPLVHFNDISSIMEKDGG